VYRGFTPGISYRAFLERARALADSDVVRCQTSPRTAQVMECGVVIRDPDDASRFYLSAHFVEGDADVVAFYDSAGFGDKRGVPLVDRTKHELARLFGRPRPIGKSGWEWRYGRRAVRLTWRGRGTARWVSITLMDRDVMDRISRYAKAAKSRKS
jgi:GNAT superfamily N-acetyltransferase